MEHVKPRPYWATLHAVVAVFSDYSRRFSRRFRQLYNANYRPTTVVAVFGDCSRRSRRL